VAHQSARLLDERLDEPEIVLPDPDVLELLEDMSPVLN